MNNKNTLWSCKIGVSGDMILPRGSDMAMREAIARAFKALTGREAEFIFSGWSGELTANEQRVVDDE